MCLDIYIYTFVFYLVDEIKYKVMFIHTYDNTWSHVPLFKLKVENYSALVGFTLD
jgi:hypothetical protein